MSKPAFSRKRKGKKVDPYPLGPKEKGKTTRTKKSRGRPKRPKTVSWAQGFEGHLKDETLLVFLYGEETGIIGKVTNIDKEEIEVEVMNEEVETVHSDWLEEGDSHTVRETDKKDFGLEVYEIGPSTWKEEIDYDVRNLQVGDEEQVRLFETTATVRERLETYADAGVSPEEVQVISDQLYLLYDSGNLSYEKSYEAEEKVKEILKNYMSHRELFDKNDAVWEEAFFLAMDEEDEE